MWKPSPLAEGTRVAYSELPGREMSSVRGGGYESLGVNWLNRSDWFCMVR